MGHHGRGAPEAHTPSQRQLRVGELIRHAIADLLSRGEILDEEVSRLMITVPEVRVSPDLRNATVYITPLGGGDHKAAEKAMARNARYIRGRVATAINLRYAPELTFRYDDRFEESAHIDEILASPDVRRDLGDKPDDQDAS